MPSVVILSPVENGKRLKLTRQILDVVDGQQTWRDVPDRDQALEAGLCSQQDLSNSHQRVIVALAEDVPPAPAEKGMLARLGLRK